MPSSSSVAAPGLDVCLGLASPALASPVCAAPEAPTVDPEAVFAVAVDASSIASGSLRNALKDNRQQCDRHDPAKRCTRGPDIDTHALEHRLVCLVIQLHVGSFAQPPQVSQLYGAQLRDRVALLR